MRALLNFARLPDDAAAVLGEDLRRRGLEVVAITSHRGEDPERFGPGIRTEWWHDYRPEGAGRRWDGPTLEEVLGGDGIVRMLPMVERPAPRIGGSSEAIWRLRSDLARAWALLRDVRPDVLLSLDDPESGLDFFLQRLCSTSGVPSLWIRRGLTAFSRVATVDPFAPIAVDPGRLSSTTLDIGGAATAEARARVDHILSDMVQGVDADVIPHVRREWVSTPPLRRLVRRAAGRSAAVNTWRRARPLLGGRAFLEQLREQHDAEAGPWLDDGAPTAVLALHYQPELSTLTRGSWAARQLETAKLLADHLPEGWRLIVKEHPSTFSVNFSKTTATFRPPGFYRRLSALPRTTLLPLAEDIRDRWDRIALVATATGTIGLEALAVGCPVIHFGDAPYSNLTGARLVASPDPAALVAAVEACRTADRRAIADGFGRTVGMIEAASHQDDSPILQHRMVGAMAVALDRWDLTRPPAPRD